MRGVQLDGYGGVVGWERREGGLGLRWVSVQGAAFEEDEAV